MTFDQVLEFVAVPLCSAAAGALGWAWKGGGKEGVVITKLEHISEKVDGTNTRLDEMKVDAKEHRETTTKHGEDIAALKTQHDLADKLASAIARAGRAH